MLCRACGLQSRSSDICEWCKKPLQATPGNQPTVRINTPNTAPELNVTQAMTPPGPVQPPMRMSLTGEMIEVTPLQPTASYGVQAMPVPGQEGLSPAAVSAASIKEQLCAGQVSPGERWECALAIGLPVLIVSVLLIHFAPGTYFWLAYADVFLLSAILGATGAIPSYDDAVADCAVMLVVCFFLGPLLALVVYLIVAAIKQELNTALLATLAISVAVPWLLRLVVLTSADSIAQFGLVGLFSFLSFFAFIASFAGWLISSFFRPLND